MTKTKQRDADEQAAYEAGAHARKVAIARNQSPHIKESKLRKPWEEGWDYADGQLGGVTPGEPVKEDQKQDNAAADKLDTPAKGVGQNKTVNK